MRIPEVNEAIEIVVELGERGGDLENLKRAAYRVVGDHEAGWAKEERGYSGTY